MNPTGFDRHRYMNTTTRELLSGTIFLLYLLDDDELNLHEMINWLNGMYDGYLYKEVILGSPLLPLIQAECKRKGETDVTLAIRELVETCASYPVLNPCV